MSDVTLQLSIVGGGDELVPGSTIEVEAAIHTHSETMMDDARVELLWYTTGRGTQDTAIGSARALLDPGMAVTPGFRRKVRLVVPAMPWTYQGRELQIHWVLRLSAKPKRGRLVTMDRPVVLHPSAAPFTG